MGCTSARLCLERHSACRTGGETRYEGCSISKVPMS
jgi:hypothetical protein